MAYFTYEIALLTFFFFKSKVNFKIYRVLLTWSHISADDMQLQGFFFS